MRDCDVGSIFSGKFSNFAMHQENLMDGLIPVEKDYPNATYLHAISANCQIR